MKELKQITVIGMGLLGGSITLGVLRNFSGTKAIGYSHRAKTRQKGRVLSVASEITDDIRDSVYKSDLVILATPIYTFEQILIDISDALSKGCIVTDVGSTKLFPHQWARKQLPKHIHYIGSHPIAGSEQRGVEYARDDLFDLATCIVTTTPTTNRRAADIVKRFWIKLGCAVKELTPADHDRIYSDISHVPHVLAAALINANNSKTLEFAGKGFIDTTRIASGPANIWTDVFAANSKNTIKGINKVIAELTKFKTAIKAGDRKKVEQLLKKARDKRTAMIKQKIRKRELLS
ncbi:MAG: prephenate dehydrogenase [Planctomycetes bacterium]|nr:prephenate dehydrogenase [Planctomycetota bacterium]